jgi:hypothetical protein
MAMPESGDSVGAAAPYLPDAIKIGTLTRLVPRELVDEVTASLDRTEIRRNKLPARVVVYFVMALALFYGEAYEEVMQKPAEGLNTWVPGGATGRCPRQARCARPDSGWGRSDARALRACSAAVRAEVNGRGLAFRAAAHGSRRLRAGGTGQPGEGRVFRLRKQTEKCSLPFVQLAATVECGTRAIVAAEIGKDSEGEDTLTGRILSSGAVEPGVVVMADAGLYSYRHLRMIIDTGADAILRVGANVGLLVLDWLPDGSYLSYIADPDEKRKQYRKLCGGRAKIGFRSAGRGAMDWRLGPAYGLAASLARAGGSPRACLVGTALGDAGDTLLAIYAAFGRAGWRASHLALFPEPNVADVQEHLLAQDVVWVAGGSVANLLALWRLHGIGPAMHAAWQAGVVLMGVSAGSVCWFAGGTRTPSDCRCVR